MRDVIAGLFISLDGFITRPNDNHEQPLGEGDGENADGHVVWNGAAKGL